MSTSNALEKKQIDIILKLNRLTQEGKLDWKKVLSPSGIDEEYHATFRDRRFVLDENRSFFDMLSGFREAGYTLRVFAEGQDKPLNEIPPIPATRDLIASIKRKLEASQPAQLQSLEELDEELDEWLSESEQA